MRLFLSISIIVVSLLGFSPVMANTSPYYQSLSAKLVEDAQTAVEQGKVDDAMLYYRQAMVANPKNIDTYLGLGNLHSTKGQYDLGIKYYDIALSIDPVDLFALEGRVLTNLKRQDLDAARESFRTMQQVCEITMCEQLIRVAQALEQYQQQQESN